jgi:hypothetical protein
LPGSDASSSVSTYSSSSTASRAPVVATRRSRAQ